MPELKLVKVQCVDDTGEWVTSDYVYVAVFIGRRGKKEKGEMKTSPGYYMYDGQERNLSDVIDPNYDPSDLYLVALMEQDWAKDITGPERATIVKDWMKPVFDAFGGHVLADLSSVANSVAPFMVSAIINNTVNDDLLGVKWLEPLESAGKWRGLHFKNKTQGGDYWVRFQLQ